jgi:SpoVK/Ycf46/Vps4 family AAA+-type ATPase
MITLASECLLFELPTGESLPYSADMVWAEMAGDATELFDSEVVWQATKATFHYFKHDLGRQLVSVEEFTGALEKVLRSFARTAEVCAPAGSEPDVLEYDLCRLALEAGQGCELVFFPLLRAELQRHLRQSPRVLRFCGLRGCVKQLAGARRWSPRCRTLEVEIVDYLRECLSAESGPAEVAMLVE